MIRTTSATGRRRRPRPAASAVAAAAALTFALALAGCAAHPGEDPDMDKTAVASAIEQIDGVVSADVGAYNTGRPGSYALRVGLTVDESGKAELGRVVDGAVRAVAGEARDYESVAFEVTAPDDSDPDEPVILTLSRYRDGIPFSEGEYLGSTLTLSAAEVEAVAAR